jgi:hypothetical protein
MSELMPDDDLEALFTRQRAADRERSPAFHAMRTRALATDATAAQSAPSPAWRWLLPTGAALALGIVLMLATHHPTTPPSSSDTLARQLDDIEAALQRSAAAEHELTAWQSPTDFLLQPINNTRP